MAGDSAAGNLAAALCLAATAQAAQVDAEARRLARAEERYKAGIASSLDVLDAQRSVFTAQQSAIQVRLAQRQNEIALYRALGGGWQTGQL